jgi:hypothetical protein
VSRVSQEEESPPKNVETREEGNGFARVWTQIVGVLALGFELFGLCVQRFARLTR